MAPHHLAGQTEAQDDETHGRAPASRCQSPDSDLTAGHGRTAGADTGRVLSGVSVEQAEADFADLQREFTGASRASRRGRAVKDGDPEKAGPADLGAADDDESLFDLETALRGDLAAGEAAGIKAKHIGACWDGLTVKGIGGTANYVQTFPNAFINFFDVITPLMGLLGLGRKPPEATLLDGFQGVCNPGEMVLVLGKPGSGCTTFLKAIANQRHGYTCVQGHVFYGPWTAKEFSRYRAEAVYNAEDDIHHPTLTVQQTLAFALDTKMPAKRPGNMTKAEFKEHVISTLLKMFNIQHTRNTVVGDHFVRGISGGERKRVSIAEMMITNACILSWDNSTRGLDASTALDFTRSLRILTNLYKTTTFVSLYQASENIFRLFDKVLVIDEGKQVYFGPADEARSYFEGLGFASRPRQTTPDYLTGCTDEFERVYAAGRSENDSPHSADTLRRAFQKSHHQKKLESQIAEYKANLEKEQHKHSDFQLAVKDSKRGASKRSAYQVGFHLQVWALMKRQFILKLQDRFNLTLSWVRSIIIAIVLGTLYLNLERTSASAFSKGGLLFVALLFNAFQAFSELAGTMFGRAIVNKHKAFAFHRPSALWIGQIIVDQAFSATEIMVFSIIVYFLSGLVRDAGAFFTFYLMILSGNIAMTLVFRIIGCLSPDFDYAIKFAVVVITLFVTTSGYLIQYQSEKAWLRWLYWVNPLGLVFSSLMQNEFQSIDMTCTADSLIPSGPGYTNISHQVCTLPGSKPGTTFVAGPDYIAQGFSYYAGDLWRNWAIVFSIIVLFLILNVVLGELVKFGMGGSSFKVYQRPNKERAALNEKLLQKREARRKDRSNEVGSDLSIKSESILTWENLNYDVPVPGGTRRLLDNVFGYVRPGELTALMGASGAGKTTLLDVLASRKNIGVITGDVFVDGFKPDKQFQRSTSYAEQLDLHEPTQTVREALRFSADLRQPYETPLAERHLYVEEIIALLEMEHIADCIIGNEEAGLTVEQRKRVTIGVELAAKPELLLFLDEPTSGLDSQSAFNIVRFLKKLAAAGQAILCTIHQPNATLFENFDRLLLLQRGGRTIYFGEIGEDASILRAYLKRNGAEAAPTDNVAEFMLEATGAGSSPRIGERDWADVWDESPELACVKKAIVEMREERAAIAQIANPVPEKEYASPTHHQIKVVVRRMYRVFWRSPNYLFTRLFNHFAVAFVSGLTYLNLDTSRSSLQYTVFIIFQVTVLPPLIISQVEVMFYIKRAIFFREASSKMYSPTTFVTAIIAAEMPYSILCAVVFFVCLYFMPGLDATPSRAGYQFLMVLITEVFAVTLGQGLAALTPSPRISAQFNPFLTIIFALFCGVTVPAPQIPAFWRAWLYHLDPFTRLISGMVTTALHELPVDCTSSEVNRFIAPSNMTCGEYMAPFFERGAPGYLVRNDTQDCEYCAHKVGDEFYERLNMSFDDRWRDLGIYVAFIVSNLIILFIAYDFQERFPRETSQHTPSTASSDLHQDNMCIVLFTTAHPDYPLILIDNRDEFILRPTSRPHWWTHPTSGELVLSSRDLQRAEKGTWLGITKSGVFAVLTNYREANAYDASRPVHGRRSRGAVVTAWLAGLGNSIKDGVQRLVEDDGVKGVGGFSLVCGKLRKRGEGIAVISNRAEDADQVPIVAGQRGETWGLSNTTFDAEVAWPKVEMGTRMLRATVQRAAEDKASEADLIKDLFKVLDTDTFPAIRAGTSFQEITGLLRHSIFVPELGDESQRESMDAARAKGKATWARDEGKLKAVEEILLEQQPELSAPAANGFETGTYGTQRQTVVLVDWDGNVKMVERALWDRNGHGIGRGDGDVVIEFAIEGWDE
ncbi:BMR1-like protein [Metarhizium album ARSEF 1941]|uniref:BMR1-like protein n=1 Tax=Metarhizium album (strain ARSEF 1941) TaxID=1081103 RepID=A0A0B2X5E1_METAS|nr:BMR1-like protein [Metarhizium album ARSEF 1941]KHO01599.1 BMR1-like protein [Metarhizium album ARSEF 1941]